MKVLKVSIYITPHPNSGSDSFERAAHQLVRRLFTCQSEQNAEDFRIFLVSVNLWVRTLSRSCSGIQACGHYSNAIIRLSVKTKFPQSITSAPKMNTA